MSDTQWKTVRGRGGRGGGRGGAGGGRGGPAASAAAVVKPRAVGALLYSLAPESSVTTLVLKMRRTLAARRAAVRAAFPTATTWAAALARLNDDAAVSAAPVATRMAWFRDAFGAERAALARGDLRALEAAEAYAEPWYVLALPLRVALAWPSEGGAVTDATTEPTPALTKEETGAAAAAAQVLTEVVDGFWGTEYRGTALIRHGALSAHVLKSGFPLPLTTWCTVNALRALHAQLLRRGGDDAVARASVILLLETPTLHAMTKSSSHNSLRLTGIGGHALPAETAAATTLLREIQEETGAVLAGAVLQEQAGARDCFLVDLSTADVPHALVEMPVSASPAHLKAARFVVQLHAVDTTTSGAASRAAPEAEAAEAEAPEAEAPEAEALRNLLLND